MKEKELFLSKAKFYDLISKERLPKKIVKRRIKADLSVSMVMWVRYSDIVEEHKREMAKLLKALDYRKKRKRNTA